MWLAGDGANQVLNSWSIAVKLVWDVPRATRTYLMQQVLSVGFTSARVDILARFGGFLRGLRKSPSHEVTVMVNLAAKDIRSTTGSNVRLLEECSGLDPWEYGTTRLKEELVKREEVDIKEQDKWRVGYLARLLEQRQEQHYLGQVEDENRLSTLIDSLCVN